MRSAAFVTAWKKRETQRVLAAQKMAAGDDTHYFRASLADFYVWVMGCTSGDAKRVVDTYLPGVIRVPEDTVLLRHLGITRRTTCR
jgi:hypothetical protein